MHFCICLLILIDKERCILTQVRKIDSGDGSVLKRRTKPQSLKHMVEILEKRKELSHRRDSTNGSKRKKMEISGGDERNAENNGRRKFNRGIS